MTGFGAIGYLSHRSLRTVRLDRSFLSGSSSVERGERLVAGLVAFARHLDLVVAADGVETLDQARRVKQLGCATAQGYLFAPPMAADELTEQLGRTFEV
jgi:EAL domain-containing protein (putative c-di-GMP-specific phosphodiesterase class I)